MPTDRTLERYLASAHIRGAFAALRTMPPSRPRTGDLPDPRDAAKPASFGLGLGPPWGLPTRLQPGLEARLGPEAVQRMRDEWAAAWPELALMGL